MCTYEMRRKSRFKYFVASDAFRGSRSISNMKCWKRVAFRSWRIASLAVHYKMLRHITLLLTCSCNFHRVTYRLLMEHGFGRKCVFRMAHASILQQSRLDGPCYDRLTESKLLRQYGTGSRRSAGARHPVQLSQRITMSWPCDTGRRTCSPCRRDRAGKTMLSLVYVSRLPPTDR
jgi:hypothetical protein